MSWKNEHVWRKVKNGKEYGSFLGWVNNEDFNTKSTNKNVAKQIIYKMKYDVEMRKSPIPQKNIDITLVLNEFKIFIKNSITEKNYNSYIFEIENFIKKMYIKNIDEVTSNMFLTYIHDDSTHFRKLTTSSKLKYYIYINRFMQYAEDNNYLVKNPLRKIKMQQPAKKNPNYIKMELIGPLLTVVKEDFPEYYEFIATAYYTGLRYKELMNLKWDDILWTNSTRGKVYVKNDNYRRSKNNKDRYIPLNHELELILRNHLNDTIKKHEITNNRAHEIQSYTPGIPEIRQFPRILEEHQHCFFPEIPKDKRLSQHKKHVKTFSKIAKTMGITLHKGQKFHVLRHTFGSHLMQNKAKIIEIKNWMGHQSTKTTEIYCHVDENDVTSIDKLMDI